MVGPDASQDELHESPQFEEASSQETWLDDSFLEWFVRPEVPFPLPLPGERLGGLNGQRYEIFEHLGGGAMGHVFRALDHELQRIVALKFLNAYSESDSSDLARLLRREAMAVARLDHENIVRIYDVSEWSTGQLGGGVLARMKVPFLVMEYLKGETLGQLLRRGRPELRRALELMTDVAAGLSHAHERHLVHCDLKPGNIFVLPSGRAKLLDFGLSRFSGNSTTSLELNNAGTPAYMAPEQWRGEPTDACTDIWSAGIVFFELLTGQHPFPTASFQELRERVLSIEPLPSVSAYRSDLPAQVEQIVAATLAKERARRIPCGAELLRRFREVQKRPVVRPPVFQASAPRQERMTLMSCRLTFAGDASRSLAPEEYGEVEAMFQRTCSDIIAEHGGLISTSIGAEVLACFYHPDNQTRELDLALRAALYMTTPEMLPFLSSHGYAVGVGVHTDQVLLAGAATGTDMAAPIMRGEILAVVGWLASVAEPNSIILSDQAYALVRDRFDVDCLGPRAFRALSRTVRMNLYRVHARERGPA